MKRIPHALIVDDARFMREILREVVAPLAEEVLEAATAAEACRLARAYAPGLVTMDITLDAEETAQGLVALETVRQAAPAARLVVVTALEQRWLLEEVWARGAHAFIRKPFGKDALRRTLCAVLEDPQ